jgi:hypothetical protein
LRCPNRRDRIDASVTFQPVPVLDGKGVDSVEKVTDEQYVAAATAD